MARGVRVGQAGVNDAGDALRRHLGMNNDAGELKMDAMVRSAEGVSWL